MLIKERIKKLRELMKAKKIDFVYIPTNDFHLSEYVGDYFKEREFISGFNGSAGTIIIGLEDANLWTDGRYFLQAEAQLKNTGIVLQKMDDKNIPLNYLKRILHNSVLCLDLRSVSTSFGKELLKIVDNTNSTLLNEDLINEIWTDRTDLSKSKAYELPLKIVGKTRNEKILAIKDKMKDSKVDTLVISSLDDIMWILNIRGDDVLFNPVLLSYLIIFEDKIVLFIQDQVLNSDIQEKLIKENIEIKDYSEIYNYLSSLNQKKIAFDESKNNFALYQAIINNNDIITINNYDYIPKHIKNETEIKNIKKAHLLDGISVCKFLFWLKNTKEEISELSVSDKLHSFRQKQKSFISESFTTIVGYKEHGAIIHYAPSIESDKKIERQSLLLIDSGGQYLQGTTDITRTIVMGKLTKQEKRDFTLVLKGHLSLMNIVFLEGTRGCNIDILAREALWKTYRNYNHGTGHGVGMLLNVHEGPNGIHFKRLTNCEFKKGMVTSNEPGIYIANEYGIRHENLVLCVEKTKNDYGTFLGFENLTLVPFDLKGIDVKLLNEEEKHILNKYHQLVYRKISPYLDLKEKKWLKEATKNI